MKTPKIRYLNNNFDEAAILACLVDMAFEPGFQVSDDNQTILAALRRSSEEFRYAGIDEMSTLLKDYHDNQITGLVNNIKGIAHEMEFVRIENEDGDGIYASLYPDTNHPGYDVQLYDEATGHHWPVQLKATDNKSYVEQWIEQHPDGEIFVTEELAREMNLETSGIENEELTTNVESFVDRLIEYGEDESLSSCFVGLTAASAALIIWELWRRYKADEISYSRFKLLATMATGGKAIKIGALIAIMSIPGVNVAVGAIMVAQLIYSATEFASEHLDDVKPPPRSARSSY